jgi:predicted GNAT family N-acyltransferase
MAKSSGSAGRRIAEPQTAYGTYQFDEKLNRLMEKVIQENGLAQFEVSENPVSGIITLSRIKVPAELRGQGRGDRAMRALTAFADENNRIVDLTPEPLEEASYTRGYARGYKRLVEWYKSYGFRMNTGRYQDFASSERMIRTPK